MSPRLINILLAVSSFALYYLVIGPIYSGVGTIWQPENGGIKALKASNVQYDQTIKEAQALSGQAAALNNQYVAINDTSKKTMLIMVPKAIDPVRLLSEMNVIASQSGVSLGSISYADMPTATKLAGAYDISFSVKTTYPKFKEFMRYYEKSMRLFTLQNVSFTAPTKSDSSDLINFQVKLRTYYLK